MHPFSANDFAKAIRNGSSPQEINQTLETINVDLVDILCQIIKAGGIVSTVPKDVREVQHVVSRCAFRLRNLLPEGAELVEELRGRIEELEREVEELQDEIDELEREDEP